MHPSLLLLFALASQTTDPKVTIRWHGQSFFEIESSQGTRVLTDPHNIEAYGRKQYAADVVTMSHMHNDHTQVAVVKNPARAKIFAGLKQEGKRWEWNPLQEKVRDVGIRTIGTFHDDLAGMSRGKNAIFAFDIDGLHIVHLGDLGHTLTPAQIKQIGPVDVLMIPVGGIYTLNGSEAKRVVEQLKPRLFILPMHYGTKAFMDLLPADEFLDEQTNVKKYLGNKLVVDATSKPAQPTIAVLDYKDN